MTGDEQVWNTYTRNAAMRANQHDALAEQTLSDARLRKLQALRLGDAHIAFDSMDVVQHINADLGFPHHVRVGEWVLGLHSKECEQKFAEHIGYRGEIAVLI